MTASAHRSVNVPYTTGDRYEGETCGTAHNIRHGYGVYHYSTGQGRYEGEFVNDEKHGRGTFFFEDGDAYDGQWLSDKQHGHGVLVHWTPGTGVWVYEGEFREGKRAGSGSLTMRDGGSLHGLWEEGLLVRGVEFCRRAPGQLQACVLGVGGLQAAGHGQAVGGVPEGPANEDDPQVLRVELSNTPTKWRTAEVRLWLRGLGLEEAPERASLSLSGAQLLALTDMEVLVGQCQVSSGNPELAQSWRLVLAAAHSALCSASLELAGMLRTWEDAQASAPSLKKRVIPYEDIQTTAGARFTEWRGLAVVLTQLPVRLCTSQSALHLTDEETPEQSSAAHLAAHNGCVLSAATLQSWARDVEALSTMRHANVQALLGLTFGPADDLTALAPLAMVYEAAQGRRLLFELVHTVLPDGSRQPLSFRTELRLCAGICEGLAALAARGVACGALCSINVELLQAGTDLVARITNVGSSWWRWGWRAALSVREAGQARRRALSVDEVVRKYATCPVNWLAPEVLRGAGPTEASDVYSFGLVLWEMLFRAIPFGDFSIAQIIAAVGYGRRPLRTAASPGASTETSFLHEVVSRCTQWDPLKRPSFHVLLESFRDMSDAYEKQRSRKGMLGRLGEKTEAFLSANLLLPPAKERRQPATQKALGPGPRMVRLASGEWVQVDSDLLEQFPGDEEKWRTLMALRARLASS